MLAVINNRPIMLKHCPLKQIFNVSVWAFTYKFKYWILIFLNFVLKIFNKSRKLLIRGGPLEIPGGEGWKLKKNLFKEKCLEKKFAQPLCQRKQNRTSKQQSANSLEKNSCLMQKEVKCIKKTLPEIITISYWDMHNLCNINVERKRKLVTKTKSKFFIAERVIERRGGRGTVLYYYLNFVQHFNY
jgi:hypothetical protein